MFIDKAWRDFTTGNPQTTIAYIEGGINWRHQPAELANKVFLNAGELPPPTTPVNDGVLSAKDYADTPDTNGNGIVDPEDIIVRFSNGVDNDHNGYVDDISGWDFYNDQNDPATLDSAYNHANGQMEQAAAQTNNALAGAGVCPDCRLLPIKAGAEALDRTDDLAQAWMYAADMNADVLVSTTADLRLLDLHERGGRLRLAAWHRDGRGLQRLQLDRPPGRHVPPATCCPATGWSPTHTAWISSPGPRRSKTTRRPPTGRAPATRPGARITSSPPRPPVERPPSRRPPSVACLHWFSPMESRRRLSTGSPRR